MLKRKRKRELSSQDSTPISAMIDIVFLLLIYFILTQKPIIEDTRLNFSPARRGEICGTEFRDQRFCISGD